MLHADAPLSVPDIARAAGVTYAVAKSALRTLEARGLVVRRLRVGRDEFMPNKQSNYYPMAYGTALVDLPIDTAIKGQNVQAVYAYGSMATPGGGASRSDIDVLVVGDVKDPEKLAFGLAESGKRLGRRIDALILTPEQLDEGRTRSDSHLMSALAGVRIRGSLA